MTTTTEQPIPAVAPPGDRRGVTVPLPHSSELSGFYDLSLARRRASLRERAELTGQELRILSGEEGLCAEQADHMVENVLGVMGLPLGLCVNLRVDGRDRLVPMAIEEASVVAAASHAAKLLRAGGGVHTAATPANMIGQVQLLEVPDPEGATAAILDARDELIGRANSRDACLVRCGGGAVQIEVRRLPARPGDPVGEMLVVHLIVDVRDAMGANTVNTMCEYLAPRIEQLSGGRARLRIVSNLADRRTVKAFGAVPLRALERKGCGDALTLARGIEEASVFAERDPYRAATHNKGIMNGVDAVLLALGQDWRAVEAGAHAFAARDGQYTALSSWRVDGEALRGELEIPMPVGVVGGVTGVHPTCAVACRLAGVSSASDLARITAAVGLAQNLGALRALAAEGIQAGHMRVHARNLAVAAGAVGPEVERVARSMGRAGQGPVNLEAARETLLASRRQQARGSDPARMRQRFQQLREAYLGQVEAHIDEVLEQATGADSSLSRMCGYHLQTGGKRLRALLPLLVAEALGSDPARLVPFGAACEMLHNATLVHDDLQDGDRQRRGAETIWSRFGVPQAINLGDAMFYYTLLLLERLELPPARRRAVTRRVLQETLRVIDGQEREFALKSGEASMDAYLAMVQGKTSGLFALPMAGAAALVGAPESIVDGLQEAARHMGVLFQIQDDVLDLYGDKGREARGSDILEGKRSVLVVHALQHAAGRRARWLRQLLDGDRAQTAASDVEAAIQMLREVGSLAYALHEMGRRQEQAVQVMRRLRHPLLASLVEAMCTLFLEPIGPVMALHGGRT